MELPAIKEALAHRADEVCRFLFPKGKQERNDWCVGDLSGAEGNSLKVCTNGPKAGIWTDFAGGGGGNNLLDLWMKVRNLDFRPALDEVREWLGKHGVSTPAHERRAEKKREYAKPNKKGLTRICDKVTFYLHAERRLPMEVIERYKFAATVEQDAVVFPFLHERAPHECQMFKCVKLERDEKGKKISWTSKDTAKVLFGKHTVRPGDRWLLISEGEIDCATWHSLDIPGLCCTSVPFGAKHESKDGRDPNEEWIENDWEFLHSFERIYLAYDMDEEGQRAKACVAKRLGLELCWIIDLPAPWKDANEALQAGEDNVLREAFDTARTIDPETLKPAREFRAAAIDILCSGDEETRRGIPLPFGAHPFHIRWNEVTLVTGINGSGKSVILNFVCVYLFKLGHPCAIASLEIKSEQTYANMIMQTVGKPKIELEDANRAADWLDAGVWFFDHVGTIKYQELLKTFRYAYRRYGVRVFVIDSFMACGIREDDLDAQQKFANDIADFVNEFPVHVFVVAHPRKQKDDDAPIGKMDVKGSGGLTDRVHNVLVVHRNTKKEKGIEKMRKLEDSEAKIAAEDRTKPDSNLFVEKQRNGKGELPTIDLWFDKDTRQFYGHYRPKSTLFSFLDEKAAPTPEPVQEPSDGVEDDQPF